MITNQGAFSTEKPMELYGLSTDEKPTEKFGHTTIPNGSTFVEMDTLNVYFYDSDSDSWTGGE